MAALDLSDLGLRATMGRVVRHGEGYAQEVTIEDAGFGDALARLRKAAEEFAAAWEAMPVGVREGFDGSTITLRAHPMIAIEEPDGSVTWRAG